MSLTDDRLSPSCGLAGDDHECWTCAEFDNDRAPTRGPNTDGADSDSPLGVGSDGDSPADSVVSRYRNSRALRLDGRYGVPSPRLRRGHRRLWVLGGHDGPFVGGNSRGATTPELTVFVAGTCAGAVLVGTLAGSLIADWFGSLLAVWP